MNHASKVQRMTETSPRAAAFAAAAVGVQVGAAIVATRFVIQESDPLSLAFLRYGIGVLCLLPFAATRPWPRIAMPHLPMIALLGTLQFAVVVYLLNVSLQFIASAPSALLFTTFPLMTMVIAALIGRETLTLAKVVGVCLTIVGVGAVLGTEAISGFAGGDSVLGASAALGAALAGALCSVFYAPYLRRYSALSLGVVAMFASVLALAAALLLQGGAQRLAGVFGSISSGGWLAIAFIGASSGIGYFLWLWALARASPTRVTIFLSLSPVTAALLGALALGESLTWSILIGTTLVVAGLFAAFRPEV